MPHTAPRRGPAAVLAAAALVLAAAGTAGAFENVKDGEPMPAFALKDTTGAEVSSASLAGKAQVILFFREGVNTAHALKRIGRSAKAMAGKGVAYLGVYLDKAAPEEARKMADDEAADFPVLMGTEEFYGTMGIKALPTTAWVDTKGKLIHEVNLAPFDLEQEATEYAQVALGTKTAADAELALRPQDAAPETAEEKQAKKLYGLAMILMERGMKEQAVAKLREILEKDPGFCDAHILLGHTYLDDGKVEEAVKEFEYVIKCDPNSNDAKLGLGMAHAHKGEFDQAIEWYQGALRLNPKPEKVYYELGRAYEKKGELDKAVESYKHALTRLFGNQ